jgi:hypothetical protein
MGAIMARVFPNSPEKEGANLQWIKKAHRALWRFTNKQPVFIMQIRMIDVAYRNNPLPLASMPGKPWVETGAAQHSGGPAAAAIKRFIS